MSQGIHHKSLLHKPKTIIKDFLPANNTRVVDQNVNWSERFICDLPRILDLFKIGAITLHRHALSSLQHDLLRYFDKKHVFFVGNTYLYFITRFHWYHSWLSCSPAWLELMSLAFRFPFRLLLCRRVFLRDFSFLAIRKFSSGFLMT